MAGPSQERGPAVKRRQPVPVRTRGGRILAGPGAVQKSASAFAYTSPGVQVAPKSMVPGDSSGGGVAGEVLGGIGISWDQAMDVYDRVQDRQRQPTPMAPGASTGRPNRPEPALPPAATPTPSPPMSAWLPWLIPVVLAVVGWFVFGLWGALIGLVAGAAGVWFLT